MRREARVAAALSHRRPKSCEIFFFFQAEDGIRDLTVTRVQTCALPIYRGWVGAVLMRFVDIVLSIPFLLIAIAVVAALGPGLEHTVLVLGLTRWPRYARVAFAQTLAGRSREFVEAARALGGTDVRVMLRH